MDKMTKFILKHYFGIRLILGILAVSLIGLLIYQVYSLIEIRNQPVIQRNFRVIKKPLPVIPEEMVEFRIFPGDTMETIGKRLEEKDVLLRDVFLSYLRQTKITINSQAYYKKDRNYIFEGYFFPGTYSIPVSTAPKEICEIFVQPYLYWMRDVYRYNKSTNLKPEEIVTVASIIEKEAGLDEDRAIIAGVIYNRLNEKMKLQIDATILYALGHHKSRITIEDLRVSSPYNTYQREGLPPGPICTPDKKSLYAALNPKKHSYYFYVVKTYGELKHVFATTYEEHLVNVEKYRSSINNN